MRFGSLTTILMLAGALAACEAAVPAPPGATSPAAAAPSAQLAEGMAALKRGDPAAAAASFRPLARSGNAEAQYQLALLYGDGKGVGKDMAMAVRLLRQAAGQQHLLAQTVLGGVLVDAEGEAMAESPGEGLAWLHRSAKAGNENAMAFLSLLYRNDARFRDIALADYWDEKLAERDPTYIPGPPQAATRDATEQRLAEIRKELAALDERSAENARRQRALAIRTHELTVSARKKLGRHLNLLWKLRTVREKELALLERATRTGYDRRATVLAGLQTTNASIARVEAMAPQFLGLRLLNGDVALMGPQGNFVVLATPPGGKFDASTLPRPGDRILPFESEALLMNYEDAWSGVAEDDPQALRSLASLNSLLGEYTCDRDVFGYRLSNRHSAKPGPALALDSTGILRHRSRLGDSRKNAWHEREEFAPLAQAGRIEVIPGREGECATVYLRCRDNRYCVLRTGSELAGSPALGLSFPRKESADEAAGLLRALQSGAGGQH